MIEETIRRYLVLSARTCSEKPAETAAEVRKHNRAMAQLSKLVAQISENPTLADAVFGQLLKTQDRKVQLHAAVHCLKYGYHIDQAVCLLEKMMQETNPFLAFEAEMSLLVWRGGVPGRKL